VLDGFVLLGVLCVLGSARSPPYRLVPPSSVANLVATPVLAERKTVVRPLGGKVRSCIRHDLGSPKRCEYIHAIELVSEVANHQAQQIYFGIAAIDGHDADLVCISERNSPPAFERPRGKSASPKFADTFSRACLAA
jgi:hypothetical protein